jgi:chromosome segregation protein
LTQSADLGSTATTLHEAIAEIDELMRSRFAATFDAVSAGFSRRFADLFGGGTAHLAVEPNGDELGVDVFAQPPGKRTQGLATLSGGERALTAAALLFSLIETNPPPFCVLDEVDAALDEVNVLRFAGCLRELSEQTQFVIITHNRRTMEAASTIYGLTLEDQCESRLLSLQLPTEVPVVRAVSP